ELAADGCSGGAGAGWNSAGKPVPEGGPAPENLIDGRSEWKRGPRKSAPAFRLRQQPPPLPTPVSRLPGAERDSRGLEARGPASGASRAGGAAAVRHHSLFWRSSLNRRSKFGQLDRHRAG